MGTNFYIAKTYNKDGDFDDRGDPKTHIGKRSAAGLYCWDCGISLHRKGPEFVHHSCCCTKEEKTEACRHVYGQFGRGTPIDVMIKCEQNRWWHKKCPKCGKAPAKVTLINSAAGKELGFNKKPLSKRGVGSCCSFGWAMMLEDFFKIPKRGKTIVDEYGNLFTRKEFEAILKDCPIQSHSSVGTIFS